jgi:DNA-binding CsgD family transcriptional regulator
MIKQQQEQVIGAETYTIAGRKRMQLTDEQKSAIIDLRNKRMSYADIAERLSLSRNTVKSFHQRELTKYDRTKNTESTNCGYCGGKLPEEPKKRTRRFCSETCRYAYWNSHRGEKNRKVQHVQVCAYCGKEFECYASAKRKYCGAVCFNNARWGEADNGQ